MATVLTAKSHPFRKQLREWRAQKYIIDNLSPDITDPVTLEEICDFMDRSGRVDFMVGWTEEETEINVGTIKFWGLRYEEDYKDHDKQHGKQWCEVDDNKLLSFGYMVGWVQRKRDEAANEQAQDQGPK